MLINGTAGNDVLTGTDGDDVVYGLDGDDVIDGIFGADQLYGGNGNDVFRYSGVRVTSPAPATKGIIDGGSGYDTIDVSGVSPVSLTGDASTLTLTVGNQGFNVSGVEKVLLSDLSNFVSLPLRTTPLVEIWGGRGADDFSFTGNYAVVGQAGDDRFFIASSISSGRTSGYIDGGLGVDTLRTNIAFTVDLQAGTASAFDSTYILAGIENVELTAYYGQAAAYGDNGDNRISVWYDAFSGGSGVTLDGRGGNDVLVGTKDGDRLYGGSGADTLAGLAGNDFLYGGDGDDVLVGGAGDDLLNGGAGYERLTYDGIFETLTPTYGSEGLTLHSAADGNDTLRGIERIDFKDGALISDANAVGAQIIRIYDAVLGRVADDNGLDFYLDRIEDRGGSLLGVANDLIGSVEFQRATGSLTNAQFVDYVYQHTLDRAADAGGKAYYSGQLDQGLSRGSMMVSFSESAEHRDLTQEVVAQGYFNTDDNYQSVALLYDGAFGRLPDASGLTYYGERVKSGAMSLFQVAADFAGSGEFQMAIRGKTNGEIVDFIYANSLHRAPDAGGRAYYTGQLDRGGSVAQIFGDIGLSSEHYNLFASHITHGIDLA